MASLDDYADNHDAIDSRDHSNDKVCVDDFIDSQTIVPIYSGFHALARVVVSVDDYIDCDSIAATCVLRDGLLGVSADDFAWNDPVHRSGTDRKPVSEDDFTNGEQGGPPPYSASSNKGAHSIPHPAETKRWHLHRPTPGTHHQYPLKNVEGNDATEKTEDDDSWVDELGNGVPRFIYLQ